MTIFFLGVWYNLFWSGEEILYVDAKILLGNFKKKFIKYQY